MHKRVIFLLFCLCMFFLGFEAGGFQISLMQIAKSLAIGGMQNGFLVAAQYSAIIVMPVLAGRIADRFGKQKILSVFAMVFCAGCFGVIASPVYGVILLSIFVIGSGYSVCESLICAVLTDTWGETSARGLNIVQCFFSLGAVISPQVMSYGMQRLNWKWTSLFLICGCAYFVIVLLLIVFFKSKEQKTPKIQSEAADSQYSGKSFHRGFYLLVTAFFIYGGLEVGISYYIGSYILLETGSSTMSAPVLSLFWLFMVPSRLISGLLYRHKMKLLWGCYGAAAVLLAIVVFAENRMLIYPALSGLGFFLGPIWPCLMNMGAEANREQTGLAAGIMSTGCGLGAVLFPIILGISVDTFGLRIGFSFLMMMCVIGVALCIGYHRCMRQCR